MTQLHYVTPLYRRSKVVTSTVMGMGTLSTKKGRESLGGEGGGADGEDAAFGNDGGMWVSSNGDIDQQQQQQQYHSQQQRQLQLHQPDTIEAKDTPFLKELRAKVQVGMGCGGL